MTIGLDISIDSELTDEEVIQNTRVKEAIEKVRALMGVDIFQRATGEKEVRITNGLYGKEMSVVCAFSDVSVFDGYSFDESVGNSVIVRKIEGYDSPYEIGGTIYVDNCAYEVIGFTNEIGKDNTYPGIFFHPESEGTINYSQNDTNLVGIFELAISDGYRSEEVISQVLDILNEALGDNAGGEFIDFSDEIRKALNETMYTVTIFLVCIAAVSLLVAAINVVNIMYINALEKTHEIAIYRALGMKKSEIIMSFLMETGILVMFFSILGYLLGLLLSALILIFMSIPVSIPFWSVLFIIFIGFVISIIGGLKPAIKAANVSPAILLK